MVYKPGFVTEEIKHFYLFLVGVGGIRKRRRSKKERNKITKLQQGFGDKLFI